MEHYYSKEITMLIITTLLVLFSVNVSKALEYCELNYNDPHKVAYTIVVDKFGRGNFRTIQSAINSVPSQSTRWIRIRISPGIYKEKVTIPSEKSCIFLDGSGFRVTEIQWNDHETTATSPTFTSSAQNLVVQGITFRNTYNARGSVRRREDIKPALAALIQGDKVIFNKCGFIGLQDTLWDGPGRHLFTQCYIEGVIDVISGFGQSIYKECVINVPVNAYAPLLNEGFITAQGKENPSEGSGFVFLRCIVQGSGNVFLGRAYRRFSTVIFHLSFLPSCINPAGWNSWQQVGHERDLMYSETSSIGPGADTSRRVPWLKRLNAFQVRRFTDISYIDPQGYWTSRIPVLF